MNSIKRFLKLIKKQKGQGMVEYAFIIIFIAMAVFASIGLLGNTLGNYFNYFMTLF